MDNQVPMDERHRRLEAYILDYLVRRRYNVTAQAFQAEAAVSTNISALDSAEGFLFEWWAVFWDSYIARYRTQAPGVAYYNEVTQMIQEQQSQLQQVKQEEDLLIKMKIQKIKQLLEQREVAQRQHGIGIDPHTRQQPKIEQHSQLQQVKQEEDLMKWEIQKLKQLREQREVTQRQHGTGIDTYAWRQRKMNEEVASLPISDYPLDEKNIKVVDQLHPQQLQMQSPQAWHQYQLQRQMQQQQMQSSLAHQQKIHGSHAHQQQIQVSHAHQQQMQDIRAYQQQVQSSHAHQQKIQSRSALMKQYQQAALLDEQSQTSNYHLHKQDNMVGAGIIAVEGSLFSSSEENDQASNMQTGGKKRRTEPSSSSAYSSHTVGDVSSRPCRPKSKEFSQPSCMFANTGMGKILGLAENQLMGCLEPDQSVNAASTFSRDDRGSSGVDTSEGSRFSETGSIRLKADCVDLSSKNYHLVTSQNKKAYLWWTKSGHKLHIFSEHTDAITDIRFSPTAPWVATSSVDKTVRVWDVQNLASSSFKTFVGHSGSVMSLDFHPERDLVCSCDDTNEIRYWSIKKGCTRVLQASSSKVRFQPVLGRYIAGVDGSSISIMDTETLQTCGNPLKSSALNVQAVCWNSSGDLLASLSEDLIRIWKCGSGAQRDCVHELRLPAKIFRCCVFHPQRPLLAIGCSQSLECWNFEENKMTSTVEGPISALAASTMSGLASALENNGVKLWCWN